MHFSKVNPLMLQKYKRYLPTAFDESDSILEKTNKIIDSQNALIKALDEQTRETADSLNEFFSETDKHITENLSKFKDEVQDVRDSFVDFKNLIEGELLPESVTNKLEQWLSEGVFNTFINSTIFKEFEERLTIAENRLESVNVSIKDFGGMGDNTKSSFALQQAIDYVHERGGGEVRVPSGDYIIDKEIELKENVHIKGDGDSTVFHRTTAYPIGRMFHAEGTLDDNQINTTQNAMVGHTSVSVASTEGFETGDYVLILSQRIATSTDADDRQRLGHATSENHKVYFGEYKRVKNARDGVVEFVSGLLFTDYRTDRNHETHTHARPRTTIQKINFMKNVKLSDFKVNGYLANAITLTRCVDAVVENVTWTNSTVGNIVSFRHSYNCEARNLFLQYNTQQDPSTIAIRNGFKSVSSYNCGFVNCVVHYGSQPFDFTYDTSGEFTTPDIYGYVKDCKTYNTYNNAMTSHGGTYGGQVVNNQFLECRENGVSIRARNTLLSGNLITGSRSSLSKGVSLYQGSAQDVVVSDNIIKNFHYGLSTSDDALAFRYCGLLFSNNMVSDISIGLRLDRSTNARVNVKSNTLITGNSFTNFYGSGSSRGIVIAGYWRDVHIYNNNFMGGESTNVGIFGAFNSFDIHVGNNSFKGFGSGTFWFQGVEDREFFDNVIYHQQFIHPTNTTDGAINENYVNKLDMGSMQVFTHLRPYLTGQSDLGLNERRYRRIYLTEQPSVLSDISVKSNVNSINDGLNFINKLKPVTYNTETSDKTQSGLISQDVEKALNDLKLENMNLHQSHESGDSLVYDELIPYIIKAIQEISDKIK